MVEHSAASARRVRRGTVLLLGAAAGALTVVALGSSGVANASCVSFSGINSGSGAGSCQTTSIGDTAIGIGKTNTVSARGGFNTAIAIGDGSAANSVPLTPGVTNVGNVALAIGKNSTVYASGIGSSAVVVGNTSTAVAAGSFNRAMTFGNNSNSVAEGVLNTATILGNDDFAEAIGGNPYPAGVGGNTALTVGNHSLSYAHETLKLAAALGNYKAAENGINNK